jgi:hypothetical protein
MVNVPALPYPSEENAFVAQHVQLLLESLRVCTGRNLVDAEVSPEEAARRIFHGPFVVLSHNADPDPVLTYGNLAGLDLFEMTWEELVVTPSRYTAEAVERQERAQLLERVTSNGFIDDYTGIRISRQGRRFRIENATVWKLKDDKGTRKGQAVIFSLWTFL